MGAPHIDMYRTAKSDGIVESTLAFIAASGPEPELTTGP
jgi:hypothetical protein